MTKRKPVAAPDRLLPYKAELEKRKREEYSWDKLAGDIGLTIDTLRVIRYHPENARIASLRKVEEFFQGAGIHVSIDALLSDSVPA